ncbi:MAG TPA: tetratricopeptide repeat protein, partial [Pyrinomonadaceae bacterium]|nr:tetratricopeptide repeat protein [Pyrinomonadaceae bacterium]
MRRYLCLVFSLLLLFVAATAQAQQDELLSAKDLVKRGISRFSKGDIDGAIAAHNRALELDPRLAEAHFNRGKA